MKIAEEALHDKDEENVCRASAEYLEMVAIENSANCNLRCQACPTVYAKNYPGKFMSMETFKRICENMPPDIFPKRALVGYGEPFLDPLYFEKLRYLKRSNYRVGSASNFCLFDQDVTNNIIDSGLDHLNISMDANHFNASGMPLKEMLRKVDLLFRLRDTRSSPLVVGLLIMAFKSSYNFICEILQLLKDYPFNCMEIIPLMMIPTQDLYSESMSKREFIYFRERIWEEFSGLPINFDFALREDRLVGDCRADIFKTAYVNYKGEVFPCSMLAMEFPNITFSGELGWMRPLSFGRLDQLGFREIWESKNYRLFRNRFRQSKLPEQCLFCNFWRKLP